MTPSTATVITACGRGPLYAAKWLAGATVTLAAGALFAGITCGIAFALYGADGAGGALQLSLPFVSRHLSFGQAAAAYLALLALAALLYSALTLFLSELLQNAAAALLYLLFTALLALGGWALWRRHQVKGR